MITLYFDGLCEPKNPGGVATFGYVVYRDGEKISEGCGTVGAGMFGNDVSNNVAEYTAMIHGMECLISRKFDDELVVKGDSMLVIKQMTGKYMVRAPRILKLYERAVELARSFNRIKFEWVPREENEEADALSRKAFVEFLAENPKNYEEYYSRKV